MELGTTERLDLEARSAHRRAEIAKLPCCKTLNFGCVVVKKPISKRTAMHSTRPLTAAKRLKAAELKETTAPIAQSAGSEPLVEVRGGNAKLRATLAEKKHIEKIRLATGVNGRKGPTF